MLEYTKKSTPLKIAIIGLGYVGLPLTIEFSKQFSVIGFDINNNRVKELNSGFDRTNEVSTNHLKAILADTKNNLSFTANLDAIADSSVFIITVPTPLTSFNQPDLTPLLSASKMVGSVLKKDDTVIYESTTYPGCTEEDCVPVLELVSGLRFNEDFFVGYSPERINPGDKINTLTKIKKVTSGSTPAVADFVDNLYGSIITAGTHKAPSIRVAEASKIIENCQRDVNISFMNELALIFDRMGIDTTDVLEAAGTKWNFLKFKPGLVGGHCISVDPYYLVSKAESLGYVPNLLLSGRKINNDIAPFIAKKVIKMMIERHQNLNDASILILGVTFKENCPDIRNTKVIDIYKELTDFGLKADIYDPWANSDEVKWEFGIMLMGNNDTLERGNAIDLAKYKAVILTVAHDEFKMIDFSVCKGLGTIVFDCKGVIPREYADARL